MDRLDHEGRDIPVMQRAFECEQVVERNLGAIGQQRLEAVAEDVVAVERQRAVGDAVIAVIAEHDAGAAGRHAAELDRGFDRFGA